MSLSNVISLLGGVALFLFGMTLMGDGLKKVAGNKLELILYRLSNTTIKGILLGTGVTAVIQSSSATSVMVVGFVNSGMMKLRQAITIIYGALIGTSITGWIISLSSIGGSSGWASLLSTSTLSAVIAVVGIVFRMFSKKQSHHHVGDIMLGFSVLMFGMQSMSGAVSPLRSSPAFIELLTTFSNPILGIIVGTLFTSVLQSASAAIGILQALSMTGAMTFATAYPIILGIGIGAAVPVLLSALGAKVNGRRTAFSYLIIDVIGAVLCAAIYYLLDALIGFGLNGLIVDPVSIALVNTVYRVVVVAILTPAVGLVEKLVVVLVKEKEKEKKANGELDRLDERFLSHPAVAVEQSRLTVAAMAKTAQENIFRALALFDNWNADEFETVSVMEELIDSYEDRIGSYLVKLNVHELPTELNDEVSKYLHIISDFERMGDHSLNIAELAQEKKEKKISFSASAQKELDVLCSALVEIMDISINALNDNDMEAAYKVEPLEEHIDELCDLIKARHIDRIANNECTLNNGFVFNDLLGNIERVADHCSNLAVAMIELHEDEWDTHAYINKLKAMRSHNFDAYYEEYCAKYEI